MENEYIPLEKLLGSVNGSLYALAVLGAKRALQLADGEKVLIENPTGKLLNTALQEIAAAKIKAK